MKFIHTAQFDLLLLLLLLGLMLLLLCYAIHWLVQRMLMLLGFCAALAALLLWLMYTYLDRVPHWLPRSWRVPIKDKMFWLQSSTLFLVMENAEKRLWLLGVKWPKVSWFEQTLGTMGHWSLTNPHGSPQAPIGSYREFSVCSRS